MLSNVEMKYRADNFIKKHKSDKYEKGEAQSYWKDFFDIFGVDANQVGEFEFPVVRESTGKPGFIDYYWRNQLIIEHKSLGKDLDKAFEQAIDYYNSLPKKHEKPRYIIVSDFKNIRLIDFKNEFHTEEITIDQLREKIQIFKFVYSDGIKTTFRQEELNIKASEIIAKLHDVLEEDNYTGHYLEVFLIRIIFCLYAEDTGIFKPNLFYEYINRFNDEDLGEKIQKLFSILNTPENKRQNSLPEYFKAFPYVNGRLFEERIAPPNFTPKMKRSLIKACEFDWSEISPAIFGSIVQNTMDEQLRREFGAHFTSENNVKKVINSLFMDELWEEYNKNKSNPKKLEQLYDKIGRIKVFDPACGSGNFLIVSYRELRLLEYEILKTLREEGQSSLTHYFAGDITRIKIKNFYGIEIEEFPSKIAQVAMWIVEHQMNQKYKRKFNIDQADLPLKSSVNIYNINALQTDWKEILEPTDDVYVLGNPPFAGKEQQTKLQKQDLKEVFKGFKRIGNLDYVTCWYKKAAEYIQETKIECAFVSTNSICQGEQSPILWKILMEDYGLCINFAHQSFKWGNEVKKKAGVFVIIVGFSLMERKNKELFSYEKPDALPIKREARDINHYLFDFKCPFIKRENNPRYPDVVKCQKGCKPNDGGNFIIKDDELDEFLDNEPKAEKFIHPFIGSSEFINGKNRYCLWLKDAKPSEIKEMPLVHERINNIHKLRSRSKDKRTRKLADYPTEFDTSNNPETDFIMIPETSSENRRYIPIGFMNKNIIPSSACFWIGSDDKYLFGMITSKMHMTWMKYVGGRLKGDFRYNSSLVYHTFPFPETTESNKNKIRKQVDEILKIREEIGDTYKDMYDPDLMPSKLLKAHQQLDTIVDKCYQNKPFRNDEERMKFLFDLYSNYVES